MMIMNSYCVRRLVSLFFFISINYFTNGKIDKNLDYMIYNLVKNEKIKTIQNTMFNSLYFNGRFDTGYLINGSNHWIKIEFWSGITMVFSLGCNLHEMVMRILDSSTNEFTLSNGMV